MESEIESKIKEDLARMISELDDMMNVLGNDEAYELAASANNTISKLLEKLSE